MPRYSLIAVVFFAHVFAGTLCLCGSKQMDDCITQHSLLFWFLLENEEVLTVSIHQRSCSGVPALHFPLARLLTKTLTKYGGQIINTNSESTKHKRILLEVSECMIELFRTVSKQ